MHKIVVLIAICFFGLQLQALTKVEQYFIDEVMNRYAYFFDRAYLERNPILARQIIKANDRRKLGRNPRVFYDRKTFDLPNEYNNAINHTWKSAINSRTKSFGGKSKLKTSCHWGKVAKGIFENNSFPNRRNCANPIFRDYWSANDISKNIKENNIQTLCGRSLLPGVYKLSLNQFNKTIEILNTLNSTGDNARVRNFFHNLKLKEFFPKSINTIRNFASNRMMLLNHRILENIIHDENNLHENEKKLLQKASNYLKRKVKELTNSDIERISKSLSYFLTLDEKNRPVSFIYRGIQCDARLRLIMPNQNECIVGRKRGIQLQQCRHYHEDFLYRNDVKLELAQEVPATPQGFMNLSVSDLEQPTSSFNSNTYHEKKRVQAIDTNQSTYIYRNQIYTISGEFIHPGKISRILNQIDKTKNEKKPIERVQAFYEKRVLYLKDGLSFSTKEKWTLPLSNAEHMIKEFHKDMIKNEKAIHFWDYSEKFIYSWANAIENKDRYFFIDNQKYVTIGGREYSDDNIYLRIKAKDLFDESDEDKQNGVFVNGRELNQNLSKISPQNNEEIIRNYHRYYQTSCERYTVVDKEKGTFRVYNNQGEIELDTFAMTGKARSDQRSTYYEETNPYSQIGALGKSTKKTGAGIYYTGLEYSEDSPYLNDWNDNGVNRRRKEKEYYRSKFQYEIISLINEFGSLNSVFDKETALTMDFEEMIYRSGKANPIAVHSIPPGFNTPEYNLVQHRYDVFSMFLNGELESDMLRRTGGCINLTSNEDPAQRDIFKQRDNYKAFRNLFIGEDKYYCPFYVLPEEGKTQFKIVNGRLVHAPVNSLELCADTPEEQGLNGCNNKYLLSPKKRLDSNQCNISPIKISFNKKILNEDFMDIDKKKSISSHISDWIQLANDLAFNRKQTNKESKINAAIKSLEQNKCLILDALNRKNKSQSSNQENYKDQKRLKLTDHEYNQIAQMVLATMSVESDFCSGWKYTVKEFPLVGQPFVTSLKYLKGGIPEALKVLKSAPGNTVKSFINKNEKGFEELNRNWKNLGKFFKEGAQKSLADGNSRGCSQVKNSQKYLEHYLERDNDIKKLYIGEHKDGLYGLWSRSIDMDEFDPTVLRSPEISAVVSFFVLYDKYINQYKNIDRYKSSQENNSTIDQFKEYFYYLYQGQKYQLVEGFATPHLNPRIKKLNKSLNFFDLFVDVSATKN